MLRVINLEKKTTSELDGSRAAEWAISRVVKVIRREFILRGLSLLLFVCLFLST